MLIYGDFDISDFWLVTDYALENYVGEPLTGALATSIESELGYKLPLSYIELMKVQNGGLLARTSYRVRQRCIEIESIYDINRASALHWAESGRNGRLLSPVTRGQVKPLLLAAEPAQKCAASPSRMNVKSRAIAAIYVVFRMTEIAITREAS
jgi:SMI1 / KNR4 family (SUKH-1)